MIRELNCYGSSFIAANTITHPFLLQDSKQQSLLNLQLEDSERACVDLRAQLAQREEQVERERQEAEALKQRVAALDTQLQHLTAQHAADDSTQQHLRVRYFMAMV